MPRALLAISLLFSAALLPGEAFAAGKHAFETPRAPTAIETDIPWKSSMHEHFFNYQVYLATAGLKGFTESEWKAFAPPKRIEEVQKSELVIKDRYQGLLSSSYHTPDDGDFLRIVWGEAIAKKVGKVARARKSNDPDQIKLALKEVGGLSKKMGGIGKDVAWNNLFDGATAHKGKFNDPGTKDFLAVEKQTDFLDALDTPKVKKILSSQKSFHNFLKSKDVAPQAMNGMLSMYAVLSRAEGIQKADTKHLLPTVVKFLDDGKKVTADAEGALGYAIPGPYDRPEQVKVAGDADKKNPLVVGNVLAHEFQHIYDMYAGRYYTLDSEMRGFKVDVRYFEAFKKAAPKKYAELLNSDDASVRSEMQDAESFTKSFYEGPAAFGAAIATGHGYNNWIEGTFSGRFSLREALKPNNAPRQLAEYKMLRANAKKQMKTLEARKQELSARLETEHSRALEKELQKVSSDLTSARWGYGRADDQVTLHGLRLRRMRSELKWADAKSKGAKKPFDLNLSVDKEYVTP
jgi:hypothetical protein